MTSLILEAVLFVLGVLILLFGPVSTTTISLEKFEAYSVSIAIVTGLVGIGIMLWSLVLLTT